MIGEYPYSLQAERAVLGAMMLNEDAVTLAMSSLNEQDFFEHDHQVLFQAIRAVYDRQSAVDVTTVTDALLNTNQLEAIGGVKTLVDLCDGVVTVNIEYYLNILKEKTNLRSMLDVINTALDHYRNNDVGDVGDFLSATEQAVLAVTRNRRVGSFQTSEEIVNLIKEKFYRESVGSKKIGGVPSGFPDLDRMTNGFQKGDMVILAARPSMGKTALALNFALNAARLERKPVAIFSLEMTSEQLVQRMISTAASLNLDALRTMKFNGDDFVKFDDGTKKLASYQIYVDDTPAARLIDIQAKARKLKAAQEDLCLVIVDYLTMVTLGGRSRSENRQQEVAEISRGLKAMARELNVPVIVLSQLSRGVESRKEDKRPLLSDLRESGGIEQDADIVMFIYREDYYKRDEEGFNNPVSPTELLISKHRNGPTGRVNLMFLKKYGEFNSAAYEEKKRSGS